MKSVLITGADSYIGNSFKEWLSKYPDTYSADVVDVKENEWMQKDFGEYHCVVHVAGIAHVKETKDNFELYYKVNRDLAYQVAAKAKTDNVTQFIFLSSMSVYGLETGKIDASTFCKPKSNYGKSKLEAEELLNNLADDDFAIAILRPPMIYGKQCKGNYPRLANLALKLPLFPDSNNHRSMLFIDNLCEFMRLLIDKGDGGLYFPQNKEYVNTYELVRAIARVHGKRIIKIRFLEPLLQKLNLGIISKVFGSLVYEKSLSEYPENYCIVGFEQSVENTEL